MRSRRFIAACVILIFALSASTASAVPPPLHPGAIGEPLKPAPYVLRAPVQRLPPAAIQIRGATINVTFAGGKLALPPARVMLWITTAVRAVTDYYGRFPVNHANIRIIPVSGRKGVLYGHTWADHDVFTDVYVGQYTQPSDLDNDWVMTHEMVHYAFPSLEHDHHWLEEGLATYVEPIARLEAGDLNAATVWSELVEGLPRGLPRHGDRGLDHTHTWGRTYWGGAMFCLLADIHIHQQTHNRRGLRDALRAIVAHGGNIEAQWSIERALNTGDRAVGVPVLARLYDEMKSKPVAPDFAHLWRQLGVQPEGDMVAFSDNAPMARIRRAIAFNPRPKNVARTGSPVPRDMSLLP